MGIVIILLLSFFLCVYIMCFNFRTRNWSIHSNFIESTYCVLLLIVPFCFTLITGNLIIEHFNITKPGDQGLIYLIPIFLVVFISQTLIFSMKQGYLLKPSKLETSILHYITKSTTLNSKKTSKIIYISSLILIITSLGVSLFNSVDIFKRSEIINSDIQIIGISRIPEHTNKNGEKLETEYSIDYKIIETGYVGTIDNDNFDTDKLSKYYIKLKNKIDSIYSANIEVSESIKNKDNKIYKIIDIEYK